MTTAILMARPALLALPALLLVACGDATIQSTCDATAATGVCYTTSYDANAPAAKTSPSCQGNFIFDPCPSTNLLGVCTLPEDASGARVVRYLYPFGDTRTPADAAARCADAGGKLAPTG
jgi:hypothetical protein